jgi:hypothetical protein
MSVATGFIQILQVKQTQQIPQLADSWELAHPVISCGLGLGGAFGESFQE